MTELPLATRPTRHDPLRPQPGGVPWPTVDWPVDLTSEGVDVDRLTATIDRGFGAGAESATADNLAVVVTRAGKLVAERYGPGVGSDSTLISWSMAKSVTHALVGLLAADGRLDPDAPAAVSRWADDQRSAITLNDLLQMTSGLQFVEDYVDDAESNVIEMLFGAGRDDVAAYAESFPLLHAPGTVHSYSSGTTNIVSAICGRAITGGAPDATAVERYLNERLFGPIGMSSATAKFDAAGTFIGSSFVYATARDFARFGLLYLRDGVWDGVRLLPEGWVERARTPVEPTVNEACWYGSHWWLWDDRTGAFACHGYEGQYIVVVPSRDLVIVRLGKTDAAHGPDIRAWLTDMIECFEEQR